MKLIVMFLLSLLSVQGHTIEKYSCGGTEPFWGLELTDSSIVFSDFDKKPVTFKNPNYTSIGATGMDAVMLVSTPGNKVVAFVEALRFALVTDENGKELDQTKYRAHCSDGMSDKLYPYSINGFVNGKAITGCCESESNKAIHTGSY